MKLPSLEALDVDGKRALVRVDLDYSENAQGNKRQEALFKTVEYLKEKVSRLVLLGHRGRPGGKEVESLSLKPASKSFEEFLKKKWGSEAVKKLNMFIMENLRFNPGEEANDERFAEHLAEEGDVYINEAFASSHREHASIVTLPKLLPHAAGFHFKEEVENLTQVLENPKRPLTVVIGGAKKDKLKYIDDFKKFSDKVLIAGKLPDYLGEKEDEKVTVAKLLPDKEDITIHSIEKFEKAISESKTIVVSGPMGKFEGKGHRQGTERVMKAIAKASAFKVAGGGDTERAISALGLQDKFDWISVGGGAMLEFLAKRTLPGIEALIH
jgi:phosphoglycerate kinase